MSWRVMVGYTLLALLICSVASGWWRWRKVVRADRLKRWGRRARKMRR